MIRYAELAEPTWEIPDGPRIRLAPKIVHHIAHHPVRPHDHGSLYDHLAFHEHTIDAVLPSFDDPQEIRDWVADGTSREDEKRVISHLRNMADDGGIRTADGQAVLARVRLEEFPVSVYGVADFEWFSLFDNYNGNFDDEHGWVAAKLLEGVEHPHDSQMCSIFTVRGSGVTTALEGKTNLEAHLLRHTVDSIGRRIPGFMIADPRINRDPFPAADGRRRDWLAPRTSYAAALNEAGFGPVGAVADTEVFFALLPGPDME